jgi:peptidoglycan hydrolase-like protein with peptidoglycan-binding domain
MRVFVAICTFCALTALFPASAAPAAVGDADTAALQVALRAAGAYLGTVDGLRGPDTEEALVSFQERTGLVPDGIAGPHTRRALGDLGRPELGSRPLSIGVRGWDVAELQFKLAWHGFPSGPFDGAFGPRLDAAVRRFQRFAELPTIGIAGPKTMAALRRPLPTSPLDLSAPVDAPVGDAFGPRGDAFHAGVDFVAAAGTPVVSARAGRVVWAAALGSWGNTVVVRHGRGVRTLYAHLSRIDVNLLERVSTGTRLGLVGSTGDSTGPHLHFEVRVRGAAVDPLGAFVS